MDILSNALPLVAPASCTPGRTARRVLQQHTDAAHRRLHDEPLHAAVLAGTIDRDTLRRLYKRLYGFHQPLEIRLRAMSPALGALGVDLPSRERAPLLRQDLLSMGLTHERIDAIDPCGVLPAVDTPARALGCLYVLDGSRLGGTLLGRALEPLCGPGQPDARRFFLAGGDAARLWRDTCAAIERCGTQPEALAGMAAAAAETFEALEAWLAGEPGMPATLARTESMPPADADAA